MTMHAKNRPHGSPRDNNNEHRPTRAELIEANNRAFKVSLGLDPDTTKQQLDERLATVMAQQGNMCRAVLRLPSDASDAEVRDKVIMVLGWYDR